MSLSRETSPLWSVSVGRAIKRFWVSYLNFMRFRMRPRFQIGLRRFFRSSCWHVDLCSYFLHRKFCSRWNNRRINHEDYVREKARCCVISWLTFSVSISGGEYLYCACILALQWHFLKIVWVSGQMDEVNIDGIWFISASHEVPQKKETTFHNSIQCEGNVVNDA